MDFSDYTLHAAAWAQQAIAHDPEDPLTALYNHVNDLSLPREDRQTIRRAAEAMLRIWRGERYGPLRLKAWQPIGERRRAEKTDQG
jgi:hypothetical protein